MDFIRDDIYDSGLDDYIGEVEDQKLYTVSTHWSPGPYEYPADGDMELSFVRWEEKKANCMEIFDHYDPCPDCGSQLKAKTLAQGGGVECPNKKCSYWFCY